MLTATYLVLVLAELGAASSSLLRIAGYAAIYHRARAAEDDEGAA
jgi:hypothetical protein